MITLEDRICLWAQEQPGHPAVTCDGRTLTYSQLWTAVDERARHLEASGGRIVAFRALPAIDTVVEYLALHRAGAIAAPLDARCPETTFQDLKQKMQNATSLTGVADVLYTTGTTGTPKGVMLSHMAISANADNLHRVQGYRPQNTVIVHGPLNHIGSLSKVQAALWSGASVILLNGLKDLNAFLATIDTHSCVATFLVPTQIRMLLRFCADRLAALAPHIDFVETGAAAITETDMRQLCRLLPNARLYNTYASTETGIIATHDFQHDGCEAGCLGRSLPHSSIEIAADGHIVCSGMTLMAGFLDDEEATQRTLREGHVHTADLGTLDAQGRLHLTGRTDDIINTGGFKVAPQEVEDAARTHPAVDDCICIAASHPLMGQALKLLVVTDCALDAKALAKHLAQRLEVHKVPLYYETVDHIEHNRNGKPDRKFYR